MPAFEYKALNATGDKEHGLLEGDSERHVITSYSIHYTKFYDS